MARRLLVVGLDGVSFQTVVEGFEENRLPTMQRILERGYLARMQSHYLPYTPESIGCFITGKNPGKTGLFGFFSYPDDAVRKLVTSRDLANPFWEELGKEVILIGLPLTYPAIPVNGILVGAVHFAPSNRNFCYPEAITEVAGKFGYTPQAENFPDPNWLMGETWSVASSCFAQQNLATHLLTSEPWELGIVYFQQTDIISHIFGTVSSAMSEESFQASVLDMVENIDSWLGRLLPQLGPDINLILFSDHGGGVSYEYVIDVLKVLRRTGFPTVKLFYGSMSRIGVRIPGLHRKDIAAKLVAKERLQRALAPLKGLNSEELVRGLKRADEVYRGNRLSEGPDFLLELAANTTDARDFPPVSRQRSYGHEIDGFTLLGPVASTRPSGISRDQVHCTYDLTATILGYFGHEIPADFDGKPVVAIGGASGL